MPGFFPAARLLSSQTRRTYRDPRIPHRLLERPAFGNVTFFPGATVNQKPRTRLSRKSMLPWVGLLTGIALLFVGSMVYAGVTGRHPPAGPPSVVAGNSRH
jgi:hypothetical protein